MDLFEAVIGLRRELESIGGCPLCAGAHRFLSLRDGLDMGAGRKAYITRMGERSIMADLVDIFDYAEPDLVGTVEQQKLFHEEWWKSLGIELPKPL